MRPRRARRLNRFLALVALGWLAAAGTAVARADLVDDYIVAHAPAVCATLDAYPSVDGIEGVGAAIVDDGPAPAAAGQVIARAIFGWCPEHLPELEAFIAKWSPAQVIA